MHLELAKLTFAISPRKSILTPDNPVRVNFDDDDFILIALFHVKSSMLNYTEQMLIQIRNIPEKITCVHE